MKSKAYLQSQKLEIPSAYRIDNLSDIETQILSGIDSITTGTGTTGDTLTHISGTVTTAGTILEAGIGTSGMVVITFTTFLLAHLLDRKLNRNQDLDQDNLYNQENQENQNQD